jgi:hypothetical protein
MKITQSAAANAVGTLGRDSRRFEPRFTAELMARDYLAAFLLLPALRQTPQMSVSDRRELNPKGFANRAKHDSRPEGGWRGWHMGRRPSVGLEMDPATAGLLPLIRIL